MDTIRSVQVNKIKIFQLKEENGKIVPVYPDLFRRRLNEK